MNGKETALSNLGKCISKLEQCSSITSIFPDLDQDNTDSINLVTRIHPERQVLHDITVGTRMNFRITIENINGPGQPEKERTSQRIIMLRMTEGLLDMAASLFNAMLAAKIERGTAEERAAILNELTTSLWGGFEEEDTQADFEKKVAEAMAKMGVSSKIVPGVTMPKEDGNEL